MIRLLLLSTLALSSLALYAQAPGCSRVDLRNNSVLGPVWDQGSVGSCVSFAAADLLSYHLRERLSPLALHIALHRNSPTPLVAGGSVAGPACEVALQGYMCRESQLPSRQFGSRQFMQWNQAIIEMRRNIARTRQCTPAALQALHNIFPGVTAEQFTTMAIYNRDADYISNLRNLVCRNPPHFRVRPIVRTAPANYENIDRQLNATKPMILTYSSLVLNNPDPNYSGNDRAGHASLIVGRRFNPRTRQCEYLIRNSYGPGCAAYAPNECEAGNVWIRRDALMRRSNVITYLD